MSRQADYFRGFLCAMLLLAVTPAFARVKVTKLAEKLLYGDQATRNEAIKEFNKLPADAQERLVPDFMVALTDDDPQVRKISSRILKAMGVKTEAQIPDVKKEAPLASSTTAPGGDDKWADLKKMQGEESGRYADLKHQIDSEKKGQISLDASQFQAEAAAPAASVLSTVTDSLKDPDPWVRSQAARRLAMIHPAPVEAIPALIKMLGDKETESRRAAVAALGSFGHLAKEAVIPLNAAMSDPDPAVRTLAADALQAIQLPQ